MVWCTAAYVKSYAQLKYSDFLEGTFANDTAFETFITGTLLPAVEGHIEAYCSRDFDADYPSGVPAAVKDICARAAANVLQYMIANKQGPLVRVEDFKLAIPEQEILTPALKKLLESWRYRPSHVKSTDYTVIDES